MSLADIPFASSSNEIRLVNPLESADWDTNLTNLPGAGFFHTCIWARVLNETYGYQPLYHATFGSGRIRTLLPLMEINSWLTGRRGVGLPFTDLAEPLCPDAESFHRLFQAAKHLAGKRQWKYLECRGGKKWLPDAPASTSFLNHTLNLASGETALFAGFEDSVRRAVRKAERNNLNLEFSQSLESMQAFYHLLCQTRRRHGVPPQPFSFFASIQRHVLANNHGWIVLARHDNRPVAGAIFFHFGCHSIYKFGASDENCQHLRANNLVMWRAIQHYAQEGFGHLNFGRTSLSNTGLRKFKLGWGASEEQVEYVRYAPRAAAFITARDEAQGWYNRIFQTLPLPLSRLAGALLYRHIA
jgi:hypothetical protein